ncbi:MAG TPA: hypothetical protein VH482_23930 [Thermomicrobiales bacterium]
MSATATPSDDLTAEIAPEWRTWGPYLSERQWGTVREDYSEGGAAWDSFPHDHARSRAYRWGEDGLLGLSDDQQRLCFALALWNGQDAILKERLFGLTGSEGNHGEDVKEYYFYLDATPDHAYLKGLYKYPQRAFPYGDLVETNRSRGRLAPEYELLDTGVFAEDRYFDVLVEYAKLAPEDILVRISATNRGPEAAPLHLLPTLWFRNTWAWGRDTRRPSLRRLDDGADVRLVAADHHMIGNYVLACRGTPDLLFTENETDAKRLWGGQNATPYVKDGIDRYLVQGETDAVNPANEGTKVAAHYRLSVAPGATESILLRLSNGRVADPFKGADSAFAAAEAAADRLYEGLVPASLGEDERRVQRQALAGMIWSKQYYNYDVQEWLSGDPVGPKPPEGRKHGRNSQWRHLNSGDVISMPDKWEYPWYAAWDLAFHCIPLSLVDPDFAKDQLLLLLREWYMHPNGQLPAYEWAFGDVNPPVHALAALRIYVDERERTGVGDRSFLARVFHKLLLNFTWWVNRKDADGRNVFAGGFLGLDNISVFDRSANLPPGITLEQSDATAWMATYCLALGAMAVELAEQDRTYEDLAVKFVEHFFAVGGALNGLGEGAACLWDEEDGFYYDELHASDGREVPLKVRSLVGLIPIIAAIPIGPRLEQRAPTLMAHLRGILERHPELAAVAPARTEADGEHRLLTIVPEDRLRRILSRMVDPNEFLGDYGIRSISRTHAQPYEFHAAGQTFSIRYEPAESSTGMFGGNSNWRGPIWFPVNFLLVGGLRRLHGFYGDDFRVEYPTGSGKEATLAEIADDLARRLVAIFLRGPDGHRPVYGGTEVFQTDPHWRDHILFYEYFHGDNGAGIGASHQTGWTGLVATLIEQRARAQSAAQTQATPVAAR